MSSRHMSDNHGSSPTATSAQSCRPSRQMSSPWTQIVRGESEPIAAEPSFPQSKDSSETIASVSFVPPTMEAAAGNEKSEESGGQGNAGKKPVWRRPSNGAFEVGPVMGTSWPALSEINKAHSNPSSSDSLRSLGDVPSSSGPVSQGNASPFVPASKQIGRANPRPTPNHSLQRSFKQNSAFGFTNGTVSQPSAQGSFAELPSQNLSFRSQNQMNGFASQTHDGIDHLSQRDAYRNQNGNHHQNHGGRRYQDHGNQNWTSHRNYNGRDRNAQTQRGGPSFVRHAPPPVQPIPPQFMAAQPMQPFGSPMHFHPEMALPYYPYMPYIAPLAPAPVYYHFHEPPLNIKLQKQIHYYFSEENLITDIYIRDLMDNQGFAPLHVIAGFKKVAKLTDNIQQVVEALQDSPFVEVQGDKIRKRYNWQQWLLPKATSPAVSSSQSVERADALTSRVGNLSIGQSSGEPSSQFQSAEPENKALSDAPVSNRNDSDGPNH